MTPAVRGARLLNVSAGGFMVSSDEPLPAASFTCEFARADGSWRTELRAKTVYGRVLTERGHVPRHVSGCAFVDADEPEIEDRIRGLVRQVVGAVALKW